MDFERIFENDRRSLEKPFLEEEIKNAIWGMNGDKALGPDGFTISFFQQCWDTIKADILMVFEEFYISEEFYEHLNNTFIMLIPKKKFAKELKDFRLISLLSSVYKIIANTLTIRLKLIMKGLNSQTQGAFIKGRQNLDSVLIANECIEDRQRSGRCGVMCRLDIEKAYDNVNWNLLDYIISHLGFGVKWRSWIFFCVRTSSFSIMMNGSPAEFFRNSRGLRQGDPLSPYLFIMVSNVLSSMIVKAESGYISGFVVGSGSVSISHLQFADDTMIFCDTDLSQIGYLRCILCIFEMVTGLPINLAKSEMFGVGEVQDLDSLAWILGCKIGSLPSTYLGIPLRVAFKSKAI